MSKVDYETAAKVLMRAMGVEFSQHEHFLARKYDAEDPYNSDSAVFEGTYWSEFADAALNLFIGDVDYSVRLTSSGYEVAPFSSSTAGEIFGPYQDVWQAVFELLTRVERVGEYQ